MYIVDTYGLAVLLCVITMLCWGSWPNMKKLTDSTWRFELFYWDYVLGILAVALIIAFSLGMYGDAGRGFLADLGQATAENCLSALLGGVIFNAGNILFVAAITIAGMSVAFPVGAGLALVLGVAVNYMAMPVGSALYLWVGVVLIVSAILFSAIAYKRLSRKKNTLSRKGILLSVLAGLLFGFFYRFVAESMASDFLSPEAGKLTPYTAVFLFAVGVFASNFLFNSVLMKRPLMGTPLGIKDYFSGSSRNHVMGVAGGMIWGLGLGLSILSSGQAGYAISFGLGQGNAMIAAVWGVFIWKEFRGSPAGTNTFLSLMFGCYVTGLGMLILSRFA